MLNFFCRRSLHSLIIVITGFSSYSVQANEYTNVALIHDRAASYLSEHIDSLYQSYGQLVRIEQQINNIDSRLRLAKCEQPLDAKIVGNRQVGRLAVKVSCSAPYWSLFVTASIDVYQQIVVASQPIARGQLIANSDLSLQEVITSKLRGKYYQRYRPIVGQEARRNMPAGQAILATHIQQPIVVKKGEEIFLTAKAGSLQVKIPVIAMRDGRVGQSIMVKNPQSKRLLHAKVSAPGQAIVAM